MTHTLSGRFPRFPYSQCLLSFLMMLSLLILLPFTQQAHATNFLPGTEDIPLMNGFYANPPTSFDTPAGRIVEVRAAGPATIEQIQTFYKSTLQSLGWQLQKETDQTLILNREKEQLTITALTSKKPTTDKNITLTFTLEPK